jgi:hypothetical protein
LAGQLTKPTLYALGGPDDIAYENVSFLVEDETEDDDADDFSFLSFLGRTRLRRSSC